MRKIGMEKLRQKIRAGNELVRQARINALESAIAIDEMLSAIIAEYFADDDSRRETLYEVLSFLTTREKIETFSILETSRGIQFSKRYRRVTQRLNLLNDYRNTMVHGFLSLSYNPKLWRGRGKLTPFPLTTRLVRKMEEVGETAYDSLSIIFKRMVDQHRKGMPNSRKSLGRAPRKGENS